ncbi:hypothetical protein EVAR_18111_1 [Eumeta japonica]|uniref:Uncharacterized protein n=1 Tax=Eumeta variegata TaxID=151549 RepID=A0A4C1VI97_EUMVA|nr:hypothetical protein EVAR_18111_1 [Eumeta japonica]
MRAGACQDTLGCSTWQYLDLFVHSRRELNLARCENVDENRSGRTDSSVSGEDSAASLLKDKGAGEPSESGWSSLLRDTHNLKGVTGAFPVSWEGMRYRTGKDRANGRGERE